MVYLAKAYRYYGNHQYIIGIYQDKDIASFRSFYHCKFERADKYRYTLEEIPWIDFEAIIVSWENKQEMISYQIFENNEFDKEHAEGLYQELSQDKTICRLQKRELQALDFNMSYEDFCHAAEYWWFGNSSEVKGMHKIYEEFRKQDREVNSTVFWDMFYKSQR